MAALNLSLPILTSFPLSLSLSPPPPRFSTWSTSNGLRSVIPTLLTSGLLGYPFCLPDMIGGNAYFGRKPDVELLVRWAQANALMPAMQVSEHASFARRLASSIKKTTWNERQFRLFNAPSNGCGQARA